MKTRERFKLVLAAAFAVAVLAVLLTSCSEKASGTRQPNVPPETFIAFGPAEDSLTYYKVQVFWYGTDEDGSVDHFLVNTVGDVDRQSYPPGFDWDSLDGWTATTSKESTFVLTASNCCITLGTVKADSALWGVLVRAVDNSGSVSEEPAMLFFKATNVLPSVKMTVPDMPAGVRPSLTGHPYYEWEGDDPDGEMGAIQYKYLVIPDADGDPLTAQTFPPLSDEYVNTGGSHAAPPVGKWSQWVPADCTSIKDVDLEVYKPRAGSPPTYVWFCVAAKDEGQAVTPSTRYAKIVGIVVDVGSGVQIYIDGGPLGQRVSTTATDATKVSGIFTGTDVSFRFWGHEIRSQGQLAESFRYYWDYAGDPTSEWNFWTGVEPLRQTGIVPEWVIRYPRDGSTIVPSLGNHLLYVEVRDVNRTVTRCIFRLEVLPGPGILVDRNILYVDDNEASWLENSWQGFEASDDSLWGEILDGYPVEILDTGLHHNKRKVEIGFVNGATTVIWNVDQILDANKTDLYFLTTTRGNYLNSYVKVGGNLIIIGKDAVYNTMYWPDGSIWKGTNSGGVDLRQKLPPESISSVETWDFTPLGPAMTESGDSLFNWMWDLFGIKRMAFPKNPLRPMDALVSCDACDPAFRDTIPTIESPVRDFSGTFSSMAYITEIRDDMDVHRLYSGGLYNPSTGRYDGYGNNLLVAIYVPPTGTRGGVAYIGVPVYWFEHDKIKEMIRNLLTEFGEQPLGS